MTQTSDLVAGRELDALVAEKVTRNRPAGLPYSTDIAAAWQVVEHMKYIRLAYAVEPDRSSYNAHYVVRIFGEDGSELGVGWGDTAPLAICRAALLATRS